MTPVHRSADAATLAGIFVPGAAVAFSLLFASGPNAVSASSGETSEVLPEAIAVEFEAGRDAAEGTDAPSNLPRVFHLADRTTAPVLVEIEEPGVEPPPLTLSTVLPSQTRPIAVIDGRPVTIGEAVSPGWTVTLIDGDSRSVTLTHSSGERAVLVLGESSD